MIIIATFALNIGHPGLVFDPRKQSAKTAPNMKETSGYRSDDTV
jgi:hypothetical protein